MSNIIIRTQTIKEKQHHYLFNNNEIPVEQVKHYFDATWLQQQGLVFAKAKGRTDAIMFKQNNKQYVLKQYCRGGLPAKLSNNKYLYTGLTNTRVYKEFVLLNKMKQKGLPVSTPCYAQIIKTGVFYQAKMITQYIASSTSLADIISQSAYSDKQWQTIGALIKRFHNEQIYHADLNARNILMVGAKGYLIDFDQSSIKKGNAWKLKNLQRLKRSLLKIQKNTDIFYFNNANWNALLDGYKG